MIILTEKPSVAAAFAGALEVPRAKDGCWENGRYCIINAVGHLLETYEPHDYDPKFRRWNLDNLPIIPGRFKYKPIAKTAGQLDLIVRRLAARSNDTLLLATDAEREGELIGDEILTYAGFSGHAAARRFWVSEALTKEVILKGIADAKPLDAYASYKIQGYARQEADWLAGINLTRLISLKSGLHFSFGRVQTAVLAAIYEREHAITRFVKEKYLEVTAVLTSGHPFTVKLVNQDNAEFPNRFPENAPLVKEIAGKNNDLHSGTVTSLSKEKKTEYPPLLFNLTALQKKAHKKFSYSPQQTLEAAQALYEKHKCMSYPRTPSSVMGDDNVDLVRQVYEKLAGLYPDTASCTDPSLITPENKRLFNSEKLRDHHALIPLAALPQGASPEESNVFNLVLSQFFTALKAPYAYYSVSIDVMIAGYPFRGTGIEILRQGWKTQNDDEDDEPGEANEKNNYAGLAEGGAYPVSSVTAEEKYTRPQGHYTYASLLALMENPRGEDGKYLAGLGTPATRGAILKKLLDRKYILELKKNILITEEGKFLIETVQKNPSLASFISIPETTRWEEALNASTGAFLENIKQFVAQAVKNTVIDRQQEEKRALGTCPRCGAPVLEGKKSYYCAAYKEKNCQFTIWKENFQAAFSPGDITLLLSGKKTGVKKCKSKAGNEFQAAFFLKDGRLELEFQRKK
jgi:DNA topoisomerase-3